jgi:hypothetical protein
VNRNNFSKLIDDFEKKVRKLVAKKSKMIEEQAVNLKETRQTLHEI